MKETRFTEKDWKLFREKIILWQEIYIDKLNKEYIELLNNDDNPVDKFWSLEKQIKQDRNKVGVVTEMKRSKFIYNIVSFIDEGVINIKDLEEFSDQLNETVRFLIGE